MDMVQLFRRKLEKGQQTEIEDLDELARCYGVAFKVHTEWEKVAIDCPGASHGVQRVAPPGCRWRGQLSRPLRFFLVPLTPLTLNWEARSIQRVGARELLRGPTAASVILCSRRDEEILQRNHL